MAHINGGDGNDALTVLARNTEIGAVKLMGDGGDDVLTGADSNDSLGGGDGDDLTGPKGADTMSGGTGDDTLVWWRSRSTPLPSASSTYNGHPLYTVVGDSAPGETTGQGNQGFGAEWNVLSSAGNKIEMGG